MGELVIMDVFKAGEYPQGKYTLEDLYKIAESYDPAYHEAPVVVGHPSDNEPAFGWVKKLFVDGDTLYAEAELHPALVEMIKQGLYKKKSISLYEFPDGRKYLRHIGLLGAAPPAVKGLQDVTFKKDEEAERIVEIDFESLEELRKKQLERAKKYGIAPKPDGHLRKPKEYAHIPDDEFADPVNYKYPIDKEHIRAALSYWGMPRNRAKYTKKEQEIITKRILQAAKKYGIKTSLEQEVKNMSENIVTFSKEEFERLLKAEKEKAIKDFEEKLRQKEAELKKKEEELERLREEKMEQEIRQFVEQLKQDGKILPRDETDVVVFMKQLKKQDKVINFSENKQLGLYEWFKNFLEQLPKQVVIGEIATGREVKDEVEAEIKNYMEKHKVDYKTAVIELSKKKPELFEKSH